MKADWLCICAVLRGVLEVTVLLAFVAGGVLALAKIIH